MRDGSSRWRAPVVSHSLHTRNWGWRWSHNPIVGVLEPPAQISSMRSLLSLSWLTLSMIGSVVPGPSRPLPTTAHEQVTAHGPRIVASMRFTVISRASRSMELGAVSLLSAAASFRPLRCECFREAAARLYAPAGSKELWCAPRNLGERRCVASSFGFRAPCLLAINMPDSDRAGSDVLSTRDTLPASTGH